MPTEPASDAHQRRESTSPNIVHALQTRASFISNPFVSFGLGILLTILALVFWTPLFLIAGLFISIPVVAGEIRGLLGWRRRIIALIFIWLGIFLLWKCVPSPTAKEEQDLAASRPQLLLDLNYFKSDKVEKVGLVIRTPANKEIIETAVFEAMIPGLVTDIQPRGNIINGEPCHPDVRNGVAFNDKPILHKISITCHNVLPGSLNGVVAQFIRSPQAINFDDTMTAEFYWKFRGRTVREQMNVKPRYQ